MFENSGIFLGDILFCDEPRYRKFWQVPPLALSGWESIRCTNHFHKGKRGVTIPFWKHKSFTSTFSPHFYLLVCASVFCTLISCRYVFLSWARLIEQYFNKISSRRDLHVFWSKDGMNTFFHDSKIKLSLFNSECKKIGKIWSMQIQISSRF